MSLYSSLSCYFELSYLVSISWWTLLKDQFQERFPDKVLVSDVTFLIYSSNAYILELLFYNFCFNFPYRLEYSYVSWLSFLACFSYSCIFSLYRLVNKSILSLWNILILCLPYYRSRLSFKARSYFTFCIHSSIELFHDWKIDAFVHFF